LHHEIELLARTHRSEAPFNDVVSSVRERDADGSEVRVEMIPRRIWEEDPYSSHICFKNTNLREWLQRQQQIGNSSYGQNKTYVISFWLVREDGTYSSDIGVCTFDRRLSHFAEKFEALTAATRNEDLEKAIAWVKGAFPPNVANELLQSMRIRAAAAHGGPVPTGCIPASTLAINNEIACIMMQSMDLEFNVRLTGLRSAAHLNGREGIILGEDPINNDRWKTRMDDSVCVGVKATNFMYIRRGEYKRRPP
jgi:hypothetical protein